MSKKVDVYMMCCEIFIEKKNIFMKIFEEGNWVKWWMNFFFYLLVDNIIINCKCMKIKKVLVWLLWEF